ncbi:hypothetical protein SDC9_157730 [bioreactor metagenome]|uniref:Uncharacterized protein n=1 Tax=bioreactor metagenome TaxID=1076179 RepID=A0A645F7T6_9ZZZZ
MELFEPEHRAGEQKRLYLRLFKVEQQRAPLRHVAAPGIGVLKKRRAVEEPQPVRVAREMRGHPVHDNPNAHAVRAVNEVHQLFRLAVARGGGVVTRHLIAPAWIVRIRHQRHEFDMRIPHVRNVIHQLVREFAVTKPHLPAAEMHFVNTHRLIQRSKRTGAGA